MNNNNKLSSALIIIGSIIGFAIIGVLNYNNGLFERTYDKSEVKCENKYLYCTDMEGKPITGFLKVYYPNGNLALNTHYKDGKVYRTSEMYYENGKLKVKYSFSNGGKNQAFKAYYENGQLQGEGFSKDNKLDGPTKEYYENGKLKEEMSYKNGKRDGEKRMYYENGKLKAIGNFKNDELDGIFKDYDEDGTLIREATFKNGNLEGTVKDYDENGGLTKEVTYKDGKRTAPDSGCIREKDAQKNMIWLKCIEENVNPTYLSAYQKMDGIKSCQYLMDHLYDSCYW